MTIKNCLPVAIVIALSISQAAQADFMGAIDGRSSGLSDQSDLSVEINANSFGEEFQWAGMRVNYKVSDSLAVFADVSKVEAGTVPLNDVLTSDYAGQAFGAGVVFEMNDMLSGFNTSFKGSYHTATLPDVSELTYQGQPTETDLELGAISAKFLLSPTEPLLDNGLSWYAALGYSKIETKIAGPEDLEFEDVAGFTGAAGLVLPLSFGDMYLGVETLDGERLAGGGIRFAF